MKGIILNYENSKVVNFTTFRDMILKDTNPLHVYNPKEIKRKRLGVVVSEPKKQRSESLSLKSAGLWTTLTPYRKCIIN